MFTQQHFQQMAYIMRGTKPSTSAIDTGLSWQGRKAQMALWKRIVNEQCTTFKMDNPKFDSARYMVACGWED